MTKQQKRLGRGLSSLISVPEDDAPIPQTSAVSAPETPTESQSAPGPTPEHPTIDQGIPVNQIQPNPYQPRREMDSQELSALAESIRHSGLVQPIVVRPAGENRYEIIAGERRWRACQMAGVERVPAVVREASPEDMLELALVENIFREDLNAIDRAMAYKRYCDEFSLSAEQVAERLGEDRTTVTNYIRLLDLPQEVKQWVIEGKLSMGHARCLLAIKSPSDLLQVAKKAINLGLSVRALEKIVRDRVEARASAASPTESKDAKRPQIRALEQAFVRQLGVKVEINEAGRKGRGKIILHYHNLDEFDQIAERLDVDPNQE